MRLEASALLVRLTINLAKRAEKPISPNQMGKIVGKPSGYG
jgi:hypothetical protein